MNRIILIGNGFDLAHGLKTGYKNFINNYWEKIENNIRKDNEDRYFRNECISFDLKYVDDFNRIQLLANYNNKFLETITRKLGLNSWTDIEEEYYIALKSIIDNNNVMFNISPKYPENKTKQMKYSSIDELNDCFNQVKIDLEQYLKQEYQTNFKEGDIRNKSIYHNLLMIIGSKFNIKDFITKEEIPHEMKPDNILFVNFNYTPTEGLYYGPNAGIKADSIHIHGELYNDHNPIIFGYGDELDENYQRILRNGDNRLLENVKSIKYAETDNYKRILSFINSDDYQIFIMGHSCGNSDRTLLNTLFEHRNCQSIKLFYYEKKNEKGEKMSDNFSDTYRNITRNFTNFANLRSKVVDKTNSIPLPQIK